MNDLLNEIDLDINNYKLNDLLNLFNITINYTENDLKNIKKKVLLLHPDKSGLDKSIFLFYTSAFKILVSIYNQNNEQISKYNNNNKVEYKPYENIEIIDENSKLILDKIIKNNSNNFNKWFNTQFEKIIQNNDDGYDEWLKSTPAEKHEDVDTLDEMHKKMTKHRKHRKHINSIAKYDGFHNNIHTFGSNGTLITEKDANFSSGIFCGNFKYDDLRKVYTETLIPVDIDNYNIETNLNKLSLDEYKNQRYNQVLTPISETDALKQLEKQQKDMNIAFIQQNYELIKQEELAKKKNNDFINNLKLLKNKFF